MIWSTIAIACSGFLMAAAGWRVHAMICSMLCATVIFATILLFEGASIVSTLCTLYFGMAVLQASYFAGSFIADGFYAKGKPDRTHGVEVDQVAEADEANSAPRQGKAMGDK